MNGERAAAAQALTNALDAGTVIRHLWSGPAGTCALACLSPAALAAQSHTACPTTLMPQWLAELVTWIDDNASSGTWDSQLRRFCGLLTLSENMPDATFEQLRARVMKFLNHGARNQTAEVATRDAITSIEALLDRQAASDEPTGAEWDATTASVPATSSDRATANVRGVARKTSAGRGKNSVADTVKLGIKVTPIAQRAAQTDLAITSFLDLWQSAL